MCECVIAYDVCRHNLLPTCHFHIVLYALAGVDNEVPSAAPTEAAAVIITDSNHTSNSTTTSNMLTQSSTIWAWKRQLKVVALPPLVVAGGHVALWQHLPEAYNFTPWAIHFTYQAKYDGTFNCVCLSKHFN